MSLNLPIKLPNGEFVALETVANWRSAQGFDALRHFNGKLAVDVSADVNPALNNISDIVSDLSYSTLPVLASRHGVQYSIEGRAANQTHRIVQTAVADADVEDRHDVRMLELGHDLRFL